MTPHPSLIAAEGRELWWSNLPALAWIVVSFTSPFVVLTIALTFGLGDVVEVDGRIDVLFSTATARDLHRMLTGTLAIANVLAGLVAWGAMAVYLSKRRILEPIDWRRAMKLAIERLGTLLVVGMIEFLVVVVIAILLIAIFDVGVAALAAAVVTGVAVFIRVWLAQMIVMVEGEPAVDALRRSWDLVAGQGSEVLRTLVFTVVRLVGYGLILTVVTLAMSLLLGGFMGPTATLIWIAVVQLAFFAVLSPLFVAVAVPLYAHLRRREESDETRR